MKVRVKFEKYLVTISTHGPSSTGKIKSLGRMCDEMASTSERPVVWTFSEVPNRMEDPTDASTAFSDRYAGVVVA